MIEIKNIKTYGWEAAIRGMRNPLNSWDKSDSDFTFIAPDGLTPCIGENDLDLMKRLIKAGTDHRKFLRMIIVSMDIKAPGYWVAEHDTYKVGTVRNSCSFMHKGTSKPFELSDFSYQDERTAELLGVSIKILNKLREEYLETKDDKIFQSIRQLLPQGYNVQYTWTANYEVLQNIYFARRNHRLDEWRAFCKEIEKLPFFEELFLEN